MTCLREGFGWEEHLVQKHGGEAAWSTFGGLAGVDGAWSGR